MSQSVPPPYGYPHQIHPTLGTTQVVQVYQDGTFTRVATQSSYPETVQSGYPVFVGAPQQTYPGLDGVPQQTYPGLDGVSQQTYPEISETHIKYAQRAAQGIGITQMVLGAIMVALNIALIAITYNTTRLYSVGHGVFGGILFFWAGLLGVISARKCSRCTIISTMVLSILSVTIVPALFTVGVANIFEATTSTQLPIHYDNHIYNDNYIYNNRPRTRNPYATYNYFSRFNGPSSEYPLHSSATAITVISAVMTVLAAAGMTLAIIASAYCCRAVCCGAKNSYRR